jgi:hypothetical protein
MILETLLATVAALSPIRACPITAASALPELVGTWQVLLISGMDRPRPDSVLARSTIVPDLQACLLREQLRAQTGTYEEMVLWGVNGADRGIQRVLTHSQHGRFGLYDGRRTGDSIALRQQPIPGQTSSVVVEHRVVLRDTDHFSIASHLSNDGGHVAVAVSERLSTRRALVRRMRSGLGA